MTKPEGKDQRIEVVLEIVGDKTHKGAKLYEYINLESEAARWKLREFLEATQVVGNGSKEAGTLDTAKIVGTIIGVKTFIKPADDARGFDESAKVRRMFVADGVKADAEDAEDLDDDAEDTEYEDMSLADLKAELKERELSTKGKKPQLIARLVEDDEAEDEEEESEDGEEEYEWSDIAELSKSELKELIDEEELDIPVKKKTDVQDLRTQVAEALEIEVPEDEEEEDDDADDYEEWSKADLVTELEERSLSTKGSTKLLVNRLRKDDSEEDKPF